MGMRFLSACTSSPVSPRLKPCERCKWLPIALAPPAVSAARNVRPQLPFTSSNAEDDDIQRKGLQ